MTDISKGGIEKDIQDLVWSGPTGATIKNALPILHKLTERLIESIDNSSKEANRLSIRILWLTGALVFFAIVQIALAVVLVFHK